MRIVHLKKPYLTALMFVVMVSVPMIGSFIQTDLKASPSEKRWLATLPDFQQRESLKSYFSALNEYTNDHFGFREQLIGLNNQLKLSLNQSPSKRVIKGRDGWLFYRTRDSLLSRRTRTKEEVKAQLEERAESVFAMSELLSDRGIAYQYMIVPNKMSIYPEFLPDIYSLTDIRASYHYFIAHMNLHEKDFFLDVEQALLPHKSNELGMDLYFKNDSHWNQLGAYRTYQSILQKLSAQHPDLALQANQHAVRIYTHHAGDLAEYVGLGPRLREREPMTTHASCTHRSRVRKPKENLSHVACNVNDTKILLIGDSFSSLFYPFLAESVGELYSMPWTTSRSEIVAAVDDLQPDLVIEQIVERSLAAPIKH